MLRPICIRKQTINSPSATVYSSKYSHHPNYSTTPPEWSYVTRIASTSAVTAHKQLTAHLPQLGKVAHYAFDAVLSTSSPTPPENPLLTSFFPNARHSNSLRLPRRRPTLHRPNVRLPLPYTYSPPLSTEPPKATKTKKKIQLTCSPRLTQT